MEETGKLGNQHNMGSLSILREIFNKVRKNIGK